MPIVRKTLSQDSRVPLVLACALVFAGCARQVKPEPVQSQTSVKFSAHVAPGTPRYEEKEDEISNRPVPVESPPPEYPSAAIALGLRRVIVGAKVIVDTHGDVSEVRIAPALDPTDHPAAFDDAVRDALQHWRFVPLTFRRFAEVEDGEGNVVDSRLVSSENKPFSLDYDFVFELRNGKPVVAGATRR